MNVSAVNGAYWLPTERENVKADKGNGFAEALATAKAKETAADSVPTVCTPSYTITEEEAEYFREKYGEEYDEEHPYQLFYELVEKNIISEGDACSACDYGFFIGVESGDLNEINRQLTNGTADVWYSNYTCFKRYNEIFKSSYDKEIKTWQDIAQRKYDFFQYLIDWKGELLTPDGTKFAKSKEEMNVGFKEACNSIMKVKDVLSQIFD